MDYLVQEEALSPSAAIAKLEPLCRLNPRLSKKECEPLLAKWRNLWIGLGAVSVGRLGWGGVTDEGADVERGAAGSEG